MNKINNNKTDAKFQKINSHRECPKFTEERLSEIRQQRKKRLMQEKKNEKKEIEIYEKLVEEFKSNSKEKNLKTIQNKTGENTQKINISSKKAQIILEEGGMLDAYKEVLAQLCKNGLPEGNIFEFSSYVVKNYEKKWKEKKSKEIKNKIDQHFEGKQKENDKTLLTEGGVRIINKSLQYRDELKFIQSLDKTRSKRNVVPRINVTPPKNDRFSYLGINYLENLKLENEQNELKIIEKAKKEKSIASIKLKDSKAETKSKTENNNNSNSKEVKPKETQSNNNSNNIKNNISANKRNIKNKKK